jgi:hypothetical protein
VIDGMNRVTDEVMGELREELDEKDKIIMALRSSLASKNT